MPILYVFLFLIGGFISLVYHYVMFENIKRATKPSQVQIGFLIRFLLLAVILYFFIRMGSLSRALTVILGFLVTRIILIKMVKGHLDKENDARQKKKGGKK